MALINETAQSYYTGLEFGGYQFTSLATMVNQFMIAYVGEDKTISNIRKADVAFHAQRAIQELSFDTLISTKSNPTSISQNAAGDYNFTGTQLAVNDSSTTWDKYKANSSSNTQDDFEDDTYWPMNGSRYGLDPQHAQANGSFYIDQATGKIHFSSNISGKTVILDYISDGVATDGEMLVHKFAEEAVYKWIAHAVLSTRANTPEYVINRYKKERFAAIRQAKLRLSNINIAEITQVMRGKSKQIKH